MGIAGGTAADHKAIFKRRWIPDPIEADPTKVRVILRVIYKSYRVYTKSYLKA